MCCCRLQNEKWMNVRVGDIIKLENNQFVAADLLLLSSTEPHGLCYIETAELDGETNMKVRQSVSVTAELGNPNNLASFDGEVVCEPPNNKLDRFCGTLYWLDRKYPLTNQNMLLRGCVLRNTEACYGLVIFAGPDTKLMQNSGRTKFKRTSIDRLMNTLVLWIFGFLVCMGVILAVGNAVWEREVGSLFQSYLPWDPPVDNFMFSAFLSFWSYIIILNTVVPISLYVSLTSLFYGEPSEKEKSPSESSPSDSETKDMGFCSWLSSLYHMKDEEIRSKCGIDAVTYLSFQRHIMLLMTVVSLLSLAVILPVNFSGNLQGDSPKDFGRTTLANVSAKDSFLWLHSVFALVYFIITLLSMAHHSAKLEHREDEKASRTLMITSIPREISDPELITKHFHEAYPSCTVTDIRFCFDVHKLMKLDLERRKAMKGRLYFATKSLKDRKVTIMTHPCAQIFCCDICGFEKVDAEQYYSELEEKRTDEFNAEKQRITMKRLGIAFVTLRDERMSAVIVKDYSHVRCRSRPQQSSITTVVQSHRWGVSYAPAPSDIIW
ncbi:hypothetical protein AMECASPLE_005333 [Ameca splendens]|uniref:Uncharacterized protein n=1 Tax=Ameca splendens TaxID=208324 RepID=A0ABV0XC52_9TELE